jgi:hypothetical protein
MGKPLDLTHKNPNLFSDKWLKPPGKKVTGSGLKGILVVLVGEIEPRQV